MRALSTGCAVALLRPAAVQLTIFSYPRALNILLNGTRVFVLHNYNALYVGLSLSLRLFCTGQAGKKHYHFVQTMLLNYKYCIVWSTLSDGTMLLSIKIVTIVIGRKFVDRNIFRLRNTIFV